MKAIRPDKRHVLSTEEAMEEVEGRPDSDDFAVKMQFVMRGVSYEASWSGYCRGGKAQTQDEWREGGYFNSFPSVALYTATIIALDEEENDGIRSMIMEDFERGVITTTSVRNGAIYHGSESRLTAIGGSIFRARLLDCDDLSKVTKAYERVVGRAPLMNIGGEGPVAIGFNEDRSALYVKLVDEPAPARSVRYWRI
ncbi:hypothetical protein ACFL0V_01410 [Nanoarchaeota archaeon]